MATALAPAKPRKQLADQLDRLDGIIDLLADGLPQAVADATRAGARQAFAELLADPEAIASLKAALTPGGAMPAQGCPMPAAVGVTRPCRIARPTSAVWNAAVKTVRVSKAGIVAVVTEATVRRPA